jgi:hypothetical protein
MPIGILKWLAVRRRPLKRRKSTGVAVTIGLLFGALGVGLYLRSFVDFTICLMFTTVAAFAAAASSSPFTLIVYLTGSAIYAFHRVRISNRALAGPAS